MTTANDSTKPAPQGETPETDAVASRVYHAVDCYSDEQKRRGALEQLARSLERRLITAQAELTGMTEARDNAMRLLNEAVEKDTALRRPVEGEIAERLWVLIARGLCKLEGHDPDELLWQGVPGEPKGPRAAEYEQEAKIVAKEVSPLLESLAQRVRELTELKLPAGAQCATCGFRYSEHKGHIIPCPLCRAEAAERRAQENERDAGRLDRLQAMTMGYGKGWVLRESLRDRGMRLHETSQDDAQPTVRAAIDVALKAKG